MAMTNEDLKKVRWKLRMTQAELGEAVGRTHSTISIYERGIWPIPESVEFLVNDLVTKAGTSSDQ